MTLDEHINDTVLKQNKRLTRAFLLSALGLFGASRSCDKKPKPPVKLDADIRTNYQMPVLSEEPDFFYDSNGRKLRVVYSF